MISTRMLRTAAGTAALLLAAGGTAATAATIYTVDFTPLNGSGVTGSALLKLSDDASMLSVEITATGLVPNANHPGHIHGRFNPAGLPRNSQVPTLADDTDGDGFIEVAEGAASYGPIILAFPDLVDAGPEAPDGTLSYSATFNLLDPSIYAGDFTRVDLLGPGLNSLQLREIVLHGAFVPEGPGAGTPGEVNGSNGYLAVLPAAAGEIRPGGVTAPIPEPQSWAMMVAGFGLGGFALRRRRRLGLGGQPKLAQAAAS